MSDECFGDVSEKNTGDCDCNNDSKKDEHISNKHISVTLFATVVSSCGHGDNAPKLLFVVWVANANRVSQFATVVGASLQILLTVFPKNWLKLILSMARTWS